MNILATPNELLKTVTLPVLLVCAVLLLVLFLCKLFIELHPWKGFPVIAIDGLSPQKSWLLHGREVVEKGLAQCPGVFQVLTGVGPKLILPNRYAKEVRSNADLDFNKSFGMDFFPDYPGFEPLRAFTSADNFIRDIVRIKLNPALSVITDDLLDETAAAVHDLLGEDPEWKTITLKDQVLNLIARLHSRVFLGKELCRNERWLHVAKTYTVDSVAASFELRYTPRALRPIVHWFLPKMQSLRKLVRDSRNLIDPEIEHRRQQVDKALRAGQKSPRFRDTAGWMYEMARGRDIDLVAGQVGLTLAAMHATTETVGQALLDLCDHPEVVSPMRQEVIQVLSRDGWSKASLFKLKLMDSFLKESQRMHPQNSLPMRRYVHKPVRLSDGTVLPAKSRLLVVSDWRDPAVFPEPDRFVPDRFLKIRSEPDREGDFQLTTIGPEYMLFGYGEHSCPGRFFATNEIKTLLCHLLLKYDLRRSESMKVPSVKLESNSLVNPISWIQIRRRKEEIELLLKLAELTVVVSQVANERGCRNIL